MKRKMRAIQVLFPKTRKELLTRLFRTPGQEFYLSQLARELNVRPSSLQRELAALTEAEVLKARREGNRLYFSAEEKSVIFPELHGLIVKTAGVVDTLRSALSSIAPRIRSAFVYGSVARGEETSESDIDLLVIGEVGLSDVAPLLRNADLGRPINPTVLSVAELRKRASAGDRFVQALVEGQKLFVLGREDDLGQALEAKPSRAAQGNARGAGRASRHRRAKPKGRLPT